MYSKDKESRGRIMKVQVGKRKYMKNKERKGRIRICRKNKENVKSEEKTKGEKTIYFRKTITNTGKGNTERMKNKHKG